MPPMVGMKDVFRSSQPRWPAAASRSDGWLLALRRYLAATAALDLAWETGQLPLYTIWREGSVREKAFAVLHCAAGDLVIALVVLVGALVLAGTSAWPARRTGSIAALTILGGLACTVFSEWLNVEVRRSWAYADLMPVLPPFGTGLSPVLQWLVVPALALRAVRRRAGSGRQA
jgi:hypothetical protein